MRMGLLDLIESLLLLLNLSVFVLILVLLITLVFKEFRGDK